MKNILTDFDKEMIKRSLDLAMSNVEKGGEPFGAVLTRNQEIITEAVNEAYLTQDPTAHAEMQAIRQSAQTLNIAESADTITMYASGKPCGMCMAAMLQVKISRVVFAADDELGDAYGWGTQALYDNLKKDFGKQGAEIMHCPDSKSKEVFEAYAKKHNSSK